MTSLHVICLFAHSVQDSNSIVWSVKSRPYHNLSGCSVYQSLLRLQNAMMGNVPERKDIKFSRSILRSRSAINKLSAADEERLVSQSQFISVFLCLHSLLINQQINRST